MIISHNSETVIWPTAIDVGEGNPKIKTSPATYVILAGKVWTQPKETGISPEHNV